MKTYQIKLTKEQLQLISWACEKTARNIIGQLDSGLDDICFIAIKKHCTEEEKFPKMKEVREKIEELRQLCWKKSGGSSYGVGYSEQSDALFDINEVIRHQLYKDRGDTSIATVDAYPAHHWSTKIPLIEVEKVKIEK